MNATWPAIVVSLITLAAYIFLAVRLRFFSDHETDGGTVFTIGGFLVFASSVWYVVTTLADYPAWFVDAAYPIISIAHTGVFVIGLILTIVGLVFYADSWQERSEELSVRHEKMSLLRNLQRDAREPYHLLQLLDISVKEIVAHMPQTSGAVFLVNRKRRQLVLAASVGFNKQEQASLEQYPLDRNVVGQSLDLAEPFLADGYELIGGDKTSTRFNSGLVLPLVSGAERIGVIILLSEEVRRFHGPDLDFLSPVGEWLAEKIKSARLSRELVTARKDLESQQSERDEQRNRMNGAVAAFSSPDAIDAYCRSLVGLVGGQAVFLLGASKGSLEILGGSEPLLEPGEGLRSSLLDALDRDKPLIINQEASSDDGQSYVSQSILVIPVQLPEQQHGLVIRKNGSVISVSETELRTVQLFARLAGVLVRQRDTERLDLRRRKGLQRVLRLLRFDAVPSFDDEPDYLADQIVDVLPRSTVCATFERKNDHFICTSARRDNEMTQIELSVEPGHPLAHDLLAGEAKFVFGKQSVGRALHDVDPNNHLLELTDDNRRPVYFALCPLLKSSDTIGAVLFLVYDLAEQERGELERMLQLSVGLYSTALSVHDLSQQPAVSTSSGQSLDSSIINAINNRLAAILGSAELLLTNKELPTTLRQQIAGIVKSAEQAGDVIRAGTDERAVGDSEEDAPAVKGVNSAVERVLDHSRISGDLYMVGGQPREMHTRLRETEPVTVKTDALQALFEEALNRFAAIAEGSDVITLSTYTDERYVYLDISRHPKNFPAADRIAGFGAYESAAHVLNYRPTDAFLKTIVDYDEAYYAYDRYQDIPNYLSFRFPIAGTGETGGRPVDKSRLKVLAIDDQEIILDLIAAMCRSLGYEVSTATSGAEGARLGTERQFDIVLTDLAMPGMSGLEVGRRIHDTFPQTPIVLITGWESEISSGELNSAGIKHVLHKPFRMEQLTDLIESLTQSNQPF